MNDDLVARLRRYENEAEHAAADRIEALEAELATLRTAPPAPVDEEALRGAITKALRHDGRTSSLARSEAMSNTDVTLNTRVVTKAVMHVLNGGR